MKTHWITIWTLIAGAALSARADARLADELRGVKAGALVPEYQLTTLTGETADSRQYQGKVVVLIYLSAEQRNSERAATDADRIVKELGSESVVLLFVTADVVYRSYFEKYWEEAGLSAPLAFDGQRKLYSKLGLFVFPTTVVIDKEGRLSHVLSTRGTDYAHVLDSYLRHVLGELDAEQLNERLTARSFDRGSPRSLAARHRAAARLLRDKGLLDGACKELLAALELDPESVQIRLDLADLYLDQDRLKEGEAIVDAVLKSDPRHRRARSLKGIALFKNGQLDEAGTILTDALELNADPARTHYYLGRVYEERGEKDRALEQYRLAILQLLRE